MKRIDVIVHRHEPRRLEERYFLGLLAEEWRAADIDVRIVRGTRKQPDADLAVLHVDLSVLPDQYGRLAARYPRAINNSITDIRKSAISSLRLVPGDSWTGPVIVKTDLNYGGIPEAMLTSGLKRWLNIWRWWFARSTILQALRYAQFDSIDAVPDAIWRNKKVVVEKFVPETDGEHFVLRTYLFLGETGINRVFRSSDAIIRESDSLEWHREPPPPEILEIRRRLKIDFGILDYVMHDGNVILVDVNHTPSFGGRRPSDRALAEVRELAPAIETFF